MNTAPQRCLDERKAIIMILLIMAAGMGSRYGGMKQIDPVGKSGEFIVDYSIFDAKRAGFDKVIFVIKPEMRADFERTVGSRVRGVKVMYAYQTLDDVPAGAVIPEGRVKPWGTGHAVYAARDLIDDNFAVINADDFYGRESFEVVGKYLKNASRGRYCMAGFRLENPVTEHGTVSRGVCEVNADGMLTGITERTKIETGADGIAYLENGERFPLDAGTTVSMNLWGFTPDFKDVLAKGFEKFVRNAASSDNPLKCEYFLPIIPNALIKEGKACITILPTDERWYGVTYHEDKDSVVAALKSMRESGKYPRTLWSE